jgi:hypothetical protein
MRFPAVSGSNLAGERFSLPDDLDLPALVVVAYTRDQQSTVDTWLELVDHLAERGVATYELPTITRLGPLQRLFIDGGMRAGIPDPETRARTITLYTDVRAFRDALALPDRRVVALLLDADERVIARFTGARGETTADKVVAALGATP